MPSAPKTYQESLMRLKAAIRELPDMTDEQYENDGYRALRQALVEQAKKALDQPEMLAYYKAQHGIDDSPPRGEDDDAKLERLSQLEHTKRVEAAMTVGCDALLEALEHMVEHQGDLPKNAHVVVKDSVDLNREIGIELGDSKRRVSPVMSDNELQALTLPQKTDEDDEQDDNELDTQKIDKFRTDLEAEIFEFKLIERQLRERAPKDAATSKEWKQLVEAHKESYQILKKLVEFASKDPEAALIGKSGAKAALESVKHGNKGVRALLNNDHQAAQTHFRQAGVLATQANELVPNKPQNMSFKKKLVIAGIVFAVLAVAIGVGLSFLCPPIGAAITGAGVKSLGALQVAYHAVSAGAVVAAHTISSGAVAAAHTVSSGAVTAGHAIAAKAVVAAPYAKMAAVPTALVATGVVVKKVRDRGKAEDTKEQYDQATRTTTAPPAREDAPKGRWDGPNKL